MDCKMSFKYDTDLEKMHDDIIKAAKVVDAPYNENIIQRLLKAYEDFFKGSAVTFVTSTKPKGKRALSIRYVEIQVEHDPYEIAVSNDLLKQDKHLIHHLLTEIRRNYPIMGYGVDADVNFGVSKIWTFFQIPQPLEKAYTTTAAPKSIQNFAEYFKKYDLNVFHLFALDFRNKTTNVYFMVKDPEAFPPDKVANMIADLDLKVPSKEILEHCSKALTIYLTFTWESSRVDRICFGIAVDDPSLIPTHLDPILKKYSLHAPFQTDDRRFIYSMTPSRSGDYIKIENDYNGAMIDLMNFGIQAEVWMDDLKKQKQDIQPKTVELSGVKWVDGVSILFERITDGIPEAFRSFVRPMLLETAEKKCLNRNGSGINESDLITALLEITPEPFKPDALTNLKTLGINLDKYL